MGKIVISFNEVIELNQILKDKGLNIKVHLHDRCGSQSFTIEATDDEAQDQKDTAKKEIEKYFDHKGSTLRFSENNQEFSII